MKPPAQLLAATAVLAAPDVLEASRFFRDVLGFHESWIWTPDDPRFACVNRDGFDIYLTRSERVEGLQQCFTVDDVDSLYEEHLSNGANIIDPISDKPWMTREYTVLTPFGYHLRFWGAIRGRSTDLIPSTLVGIRTDVRVPTAEEFDRIEGAAYSDFNPLDTPRRLGAMLTGVVAIDTESGQTVGIACASGDGVNVICLMSVAVVESYRRRGIASAMLVALLHALRKQFAPGTPVILLTSMHPLYSPHGFRMNSGLMSLHL